MLDERWSHLRHSYEVVSAVMPNYVAGKPPVEDDFMPERLDGLAAVRQRLEELSVQARAEIVSFTPVASDPAAARAASRPLNLGLLRRGVRMRTLYQDSIVVEPDAMGYAVELDGAGGEIRLTPQVPLRLIVMDRSVAVVPLDPAEPALGAMMIRDPGTVAALMALFENYWRSGRPLAEVMGESGCSEVEKAILRHLAAGSKDEAVARQLGISVRTLRRGIASLMDRLEARSRFELAVLAAQRGWM
jgi:DNA-binding CsgD family transcriptional regulator